MNQRTFPYGLNDQLSIDDLRAYRAGQLSGAALHRVERILLENPFYADALDGLDALQQVGEKLHSHTRDLHIALQDRVQEAATPRRLMPLWVTSAAASILLVICVALYYFFYVLPGATNVPATEVIEPGTVLIDLNALGMSEPIQQPAVTATTAAATKAARQPRLSVKATGAHHKQPIFAAQRPQPVTYPATAQPPAELAAGTFVDLDILPLPISQVDVQRRQTVDTERAFER